jgi:mannose-6-phosphate isomerase
MILECIPVFSPRPWGDRRINENYKINSQDPIGEIWYVSDVKNMETKLKDINTRKEYNLNDFKNYFAKNSINRFPILIKLISTKEWVSVQVHPDDNLAKELENEPWGKNECWYLLNNGQIAGGMKKSFDKPLKDIKKENLDFYELKRGNFAFIKAGTVHAIGPDTELIEIQQASDLTYRLFDWNRGRELHLEKGQKALKKDNKVQIIEDFDSFKCDYFDIEKTSSPNGTGIFIQFSENPKAFIVINDVLNSSEEGLWVKSGKFWK